MDKHQLDNWFFSNLMDVKWAYNREIGNLGSTVEGVLQCWMVECQALSLVHPTRRIVRAVPTRYQSLMFRKSLLERLLGHSTTVAQLSQELRVHPKEIEQDLRHLIRSLKHTPYRPCVTPPECRRCHFVFRRDKLTKPGKCPMCKGTWITEPRISIDESS